MYPLRQEKINEDEKVGIKLITCLICLPEFHSKGIWNFSCGARECYK